MPAEPRVPAEAFFEHADLDTPALSPDGRWLAVAARLGERRGLVVFDLNDLASAKTVAHYTDADVQRFAWVGNEWLIYTLVDLYRGGGDQRWAPGLFSVRRDGYGQRALIAQRADFAYERRVRREALPYNHVLLHVPRPGAGEAAEEVLIGQLNQDANGDLRSVAAKRLNVATGRARSVSFDAPANVLAWWFGPDGDPVVVVTGEAGRRAVHKRVPGIREWKQLVEYDMLDPPFRPRFVDAAGTLYVTHTDPTTGTDVLSRFDDVTGQPSPEPFVRTPGYDFTGHLVAETDGGTVLGVRVTIDAETTVWLDPVMKAFQAEVDRRFPGHVNRIDCRHCGTPRMVALVRSWSDRDPGRYWVYRAAAPDDQRWLTVGPSRDGIDPRRMARTDLYRIRARDGLELPVWVTTPAGASPTESRKRPAVVLVHGGPWLRGREWEWDPYAQFLASLGLVVIEPEFRGSTGYGEALFRAGWRQWGRAMQDDLADAVSWAASKGLVDPERVCIAGASYGGYATLMSLVRHPNTYRCGIAWVAVTDPRLYTRWNDTSDWPEEFRRYGIPRLIGDPAADAALLDEATPVLHVERIRAPLLLAFGGRDRRVPIEHGDRMRAALQAAGKRFEYVNYADEAHGWLTLRTRLDFARRVETFLAEHLE